MFTRGWLLIAKTPATYPIVVRWVGCISLYYSALTESTVRIPTFGASGFFFGVADIKVFWLKIFNLLYLPSGKRLQFANLKMAIEIVDLPIKNGGSFHSFFCMFTRGYLYMGMNQKRHSKIAGDQHWPSIGAHQRCIVLTHCNVVIQCYTWLVVSTPLRGKKTLVSWDDDIPNIWENQKCSKPPNKYILADR